MRLLPRNTVRTRASHSAHEHLHVRIRHDDLPTLVKLATGGWLDTSPDAVSVLVSTAAMNERLCLEPYQTCTLHIPLPRKSGAGRRKTGEPTSAPLKMHIQALHMLPGKGSSLARRAIVTLCQ